MHLTTAKGGGRQTEGSRKRAHNSERETVSSRDRKFASARERAIRTENLCQYVYTQPMAPGNIERACWRVVGDRVCVCACSS